MGHRSTRGFKDSDRGPAGWFMRGTQIDINTAVLIAVSVISFCLRASLVVAVCGYMAGLTVRRTRWYRARPAGCRHHGGR